MTANNAVYLLDLTSGHTRKLIELMRAMADDLRAPPELSSIFPRNFKFEFSRIRVSVQLSEQRFDYEAARNRERDHLAGIHHDEEKTLERYKNRSVEAYERQACSISL